MDKELEQSRKNFEEIYTKSDADTQSFLNNYLKSVQNYIDSENINNFSINKLNKSAYDTAVELATGKFNNIPYPTKPIKNIFNGYSKNETKQLAEEIAYKYMTQANPDKTNIRSPYISNSNNNNNTSLNKYFVYNWNNGWNSNWSLEDDNLSNKLTEFTNILKRNILDVNDKVKEGYKIKNFPGLSSLNLTDIISKLNSILNRVGEDDNANKSLLRELHTIAQQINVDPIEFKKYFNNWLKIPLQDKSKKELLLNNYSEIADNELNNENLKNYLSNNNYHVLKGEDGNFYLFDKDYNSIQLDNPEINIDSDWTSSTYDTGYVIDKNGKIYTDYKSIGESNPLFKNVSEYISNIFNKRNNLFYTSQKPWNSMYSLSEFNLIDELSNHLNGKKFIDIGPLFNSSEQIIAVPKDGKTIKQDKYGNLILDNLDFYYYSNKDGKIHVAHDYKAAIQHFNEFNIEGYNETSEGLSNFDNRYMDLINSTESNIINNSKFNKKNPIGWSKSILNIIAKGLNRSQYENQYLADFDYNSDPLQLASILSTIIRDNNLWDELTNSQKQAYRKLIKMINNRQSKYIPNDIISEKNGGIIKAAEGTTLNLYDDKFSKNNYDIIKEERQSKKIIDEMNQRNRSESQTIANKRVVSQDLTTADVLRFGAMAQDIAGLIASFTGGNALSAGLGLTAMGTDLTADIMDKSVTKGQVLRNALFNTGMAAISWIPGANAGKLARNLIKYAPKIMGLIGAGAIAVNEDIIESWKKVGNEKLTVEDWKNIGYTLTAAAGLTRLGKGEYNHYKGKKKFKTAMTGEKKSAIKIADGSEVYIDKSDKNEINELLKKEKINEAYTKLSEITGKTKKELGSEVFTSKLTKPHKTDDGLSIHKTELNGKDIDEFDIDQLNQIIHGRDKHARRYSEEYFAFNPSAKKRIQFLRNEKYKQQAAEEAKKAEVERIEKERIAAERRAKKARRAEEARLAEEARKAEEAKKRRDRIQALWDERNAKKAEVKRLEAERIEKERIEAERRAEEIRRAKAERLEAKRIAKEKTAEEARRAEEARLAEKFRIQKENKKKFDEEVNDFKNQFENSRSTAQLETKINNLNAKNEKLLTENKNLENEINSIKKKLNSKRTSDDKKEQLKNKQLPDLENRYQANQNQIDKNNKTLSDLNKKYNDEIELKNLVDKKINRYENTNRLPANFLRLAALNSKNINEYNKYINQLNKFYSGYLNKSGKNELDIKNDLMSLIIFNNKQKNKITINDINNKTPEFFDLKHKFIQQTNLPRKQVWLTLNKFGGKLNYISFFNL